MSSFPVGHTDSAASHAGHLPGPGYPNPNKKLNLGQGNGNSYFKSGFDNGKSQIKIRLYPISK